MCSSIFPDRNDCIFVKNVEVQSFEVVICQWPEFQRRTTLGLVLLFLLLLHVLISNIWDY